MSFSGGQVSLLRKALQESIVGRGAKQFAAVRSVVVSMTAGVDVSSLFPEMLKVGRIGRVCAVCCSPTTVWCA